MSPQSTTLSEVLFKKGRRKVLELLATNPDKEFTIREISEKTKVSKPTITTLINNLKEVDLVKKRKKGVQYLIKINPSSPYFSKIKEILNLDTEPLKDLAKDAAESLQTEFPEIKSIYLFGSVAKGRPTLTSDIDLLVLVSEDAPDDIINDLMAHLEGEMPAMELNISLTVYREKELERDERRNIELMRDVKREGELLVGEKIW